LCHTAIFFVLIRQKSIKMKRKTLVSETVSSLFQHPQVQLKQVYGDWGILFHQATSQGQVIDAVGILIWQALETSHDSDQIAAVLLPAFDEAPDSLQSDVEEFLGSLLAAGFVVEEGG
jgi:hypothetical protein